MNILFLTNHLNVGGITSYLLTLAPGLKARGHTVYLASGGGEDLSEFLKAGVECIPLPLRTKQEIHPKVFISALKAEREVRKRSIDVVHSNTRTTQVAACLIKHWTKVSHVSTCHGFFKPKLVRRLFPCWGEETIAISEPVKEHLVRDMGVRADAITVIHNGIDAERFSPCISADRRAYKKKLGFADGPLVGIIARLSDVKGHRYLIEAMKTVSISFPDARLLIVGEGKMHHDLNGWTQCLNLQEYVRFVPSVSDTRDVLSALDVFVMPSLHEGLGLALMEAMAAGCPVVGSAVGGIKSLIQHEVTGLLSKPADADSIAAAIIRFLKDPAEGALMGRQARDFIRDRFSREDMVLKTEEVYQRCLSKRKR